MQSHTDQDIFERDETSVEPQPEPKVFIVAVYLVDRAYGGPEEGGWWYDCGELIRIMRTFKNERGALAYSRGLNARLDRTLNKGRREISSVLSDGQYEAQVRDDFAPKHFPETRPFYS
jgi:hypothetical protein